MKRKVSSILSMSIVGVLVVLGSSTASVAGPIKVGTVTPTGQVTANSQVVVSAPVTVTGLPDGTYYMLVTITLTGVHAPPGTQFPGTVNISGGTGTVSVQATIPPGNTGALGTIGVGVDNSNTGGSASGANSSNITWK